MSRQNFLGVCLSRVRRYRMSSVQWRERGCVCEQQNQRLDKESAIVCVCVCVCGGWVVCVCVGGGWVVCVCVCVCVGVCLPLPIYI